MTLSKLRVVLEASTSAFNRGMKKAQTGVKKFQARIVKLGAAMKAFASQIGIAVAAMAGIGLGMKKVFDLGAGIEETGSKFATVFGSEATAQVQNFLDTFANKAGLTNAEAQALVSTTGAIAQGMGFSQKASGDMSIAITKLAADLGSFNNLPTEEVIMAVNSALTGEREQLKQLGIVIKEAEVQQLALAQSGKTAAAELTNQEKATATLALITKNAGVAVGDLDRTQGSAANVAKRLGAGFREIRDALATALMPAFGQIIDRLNDSKDRFTDLKNAITENAGIISAWASLFINLMRLAASPVITLIRLVFNLGQLAIDATKALFNLLEGNWEALKQNALDMKKNFEDIGETITEQFEVVGETLQSIADIITGGIEPATDQVNTAFTNLGTVGTDAVGAVAEVIKETAEEIESMRDKLDSLTDRMAKDFVSRMTRAAQGGKDAFQGFFDYMKNRIIELALQFAIFKTLGAMFPESDFVKALAAGFNMEAALPSSTLPMPTNLPDLGPGTKAGRLSTFGNILGLRAGGRSSGMTVNQNINFSVSAIDSQDASRFIQQQKGAIAGVMAEATRNSQAYRRQLAGA